MRITKIVPKPGAFEVTVDFHIAPFSFKVADPVPEKADFILTDVFVDQTAQVKWYIESNWQTVVDKIQIFKATQG